MTVSVLTEDFFLASRVIADDFFISKRVVTDDFFLGLRVIAADFEVPINYVPFRYRADTTLITADNSVLTSDYV